MTLASTRSLVDEARARAEGVAAFNVITLEHAEGIVAGAEAAGRPIILAISENAARFHLGNVRPITAACSAIAESSSVRVALHLDHVVDVDLLHRAAEVGFSSVMYDASTQPHAENVASTRAAADWAHRNGLWLEAELGEVGGKDGAHAPGVSTDAGEAATYVADTGVDALAVAVGSSHAMTDRSAQLDHDLIAALRVAVPVPLVLHGSSGVPDAELTRAVQSGIVKVNIGTILNVAFTAAVRAHLAHDAKVVDPRKYLLPARDEMAAVVARLVIALVSPR